MKTVYILRDKIGDKQSLGALLVVENGTTLFNSHVLERGWLDNKSNVSCIPEGIYPLRLEYSGKFKRNLWEAHDVPNRSECKFHVSNYWDQLNGCFAPGQSRKDIGRDSELDMVGSGKALKSFMEAMGMDIEARLVIINDKN